MFTNSTPVDRSQDEAIVVQVDPKRKVCIVKTMDGRSLFGVRWVEAYGGSGRGGSRTTPRRGDLVVVSTGLGSPYIIGFFGKAGSISQAIPHDILSENAGVDVGNLIPETYGVVADPHKPGDLLIGDSVVASEGGGLFAVLRGGSVLLRASRLSEIFLNKLGFLVRIVSKHWEHFTDTFSDVSRNVSNRLFRYTGYARNFAEASTESYRLHHVYGDVAAGESLTTKYNSITTPPPATSNVLFKEKVTNPGSSSALMYRTLAINGDEEVWVSNGSTFTRMRATGTFLTFSFGDQHTVTIDGDKIELHHGGGAKVTLDGSGIKAHFGSGDINMSSGSVNTTFGGHFVTVSSSGVSLG